MTNLNVTNLDGELEIERNMNSENNLQMIGFNEERKSERVIAWGQIHINKLCVKMAKNCEN